MLGLGRAGPFQPRDVAAMPYFQVTHKSSDTEECIPIYTTDEYRTPEDAKDYLLPC